MLQKLQIITKNATIGRSYHLISNKLVKFAYIPPFPLWLVVIKTWLRPKRLKRKSNLTPHPHLLHAPLLPESQFAIKKTQITSLVKPRWPYLLIHLLPGLFLFQRRIRCKYSELASYPVFYSDTILPLDSKFTPQQFQLHEYL